MTALDALIREALRAGVELAVRPPDHLVARFDGEPPAGLLARLRDAKPALVALRCPGCGYVRCGDQICWREGCGYRPCGQCGQPTGSPFLRFCWACAVQPGERATGGRT